MRTTLVLSACVLALISACVAGGGSADAPSVGTPIPPSARLEVADGFGTPRHAQAVMSSKYCASCHPDIYAEHEQNTHGRAFTDEEVRLATGRFSQADCIICHTPRPTFETGIGMNPIRRHHGLEEGNSCMTCHWAPGVDYSRFVGGPDCTTAFDPRVGRVEACASCHRNHGTPYQWELSPKGKSAGRECIDCHMELVERPVAVGMPPREVRSHVFPGGRSESQLRKAYEYDARIEGNEVVVTIANKGAGHNFPTELKQRSVESLVVVRDADGQEVARSRMVLRDPYKRPYGLQLPINTQIPSGEAREQRVPIGVAEGTVECELHFKLYFPIEDYHPDLSRRLEVRRLPFRDLEPSTKPVTSEPDVRVVTPEGIPAELASPADLVDYARPEIGAVEVSIPEGDDAQAIADLINLFQFPVPAANAEARHRLVDIGLPAVPALIQALGSWDNKTWNQAMGVLQNMGAKAQPAVIAALSSPELYIRLHASEILSRTGVEGPTDAALAALRANLARESALDRSHAAETLGHLRLESARDELRRALGDQDPDVVRAAAFALAKLRDKGAIPAIQAALKSAFWTETRRDLAEVLARLGDPSGIQTLIAGLDERDDLVRESYFESLFAVTGLHEGYDPLAPRDQRLEAIAHIAAWWARNGGEGALRRPVAVSLKESSEVKKMLEAFAGGDGLTPAGDDEKLVARFLELGEKAVPGLTKIGLKYPPGFAQKRARVCEVLGRIGDPAAVPALITALRDPVISVGAWACWALEKIGDRSALTALERWHQRLLSLAAARAIPASAGTPDLLLAQAAGARYALGDARAEPDLVAFLLGEDLEARRTAATALRRVHGDLEYDAEAEPAARRAAVERWLSAR